MKKIYLISFLCVVSCANEISTDDVGLSIEELTITTNNSCLDSRTGVPIKCGFFSPSLPSGRSVSSIASDSSPKRACMRGYLKKKSADTFTCPDYDGMRDRCYRNGGNVDYYRADGCFDSGVAMGDGRSTTRTCRLSRYKAVDQTLLSREGWLTYWNDGSTCDVFEENHSDPTQLVTIPANRLDSPPPAKPGNHCTTIMVPPGAVAPTPVCIDLGGGVRQCKKC